MTTRRLRVGLATVTAAVGAALAAALVGCTAAGPTRGPAPVAPPAAEPLRVTPLAAATLPTDVPGVGRVGGLSALVFDPRPAQDTDSPDAPTPIRLLAVSDRPGTPAVYELALELRPPAADPSGEWALSGRTVREHALAGAPAADAEGIAVLPLTGAAAGSPPALFVSYEAPPTVAAAGVPGFAEPARAPSFPTPRAILRGVRPNRGYESLAVAAGADGPVVWTATESAIESDGPEATRDAGARCRVLRYTPGADRPDTFLYRTAPAPAGLPGTFAITSLAELLALPDGRLLALERSFAIPRGYDARLFAIDPAKARRDATADADSADAPGPVLDKTPVASLRALGVAPLGNVEGLALGPLLAQLTGDPAHTGRLLLLIADDNFGRDPQPPNQVIALRVEGVGAKERARR